MTEEPPELRSPPPLSSLSAVSLFLDFDGTLVAIAPGPDQIEVPQGLGLALETLGARIGQRLALVSGRALRDIERHLGTPAIAMGGSHGGEVRLADGKMLSRAARSLPGTVLQAIRTFADAHEGVIYEEKPMGAALPYRAPPDRAEEILAFADEMARQHPLQVTRGKMVAELMPSGFHKGAAVETLMYEAPFVESYPVFIGDDITDEDGFSAARSMGGFGVLVGQSRPTAAQYRLEDTRAVYDWLELNL